MTHGLLTEYVPDEEDRARLERFLALCWYHVVTEAFDRSHHPREWGAHARRCWEFLVKEIGPVRRAEREETLWWVERHVTGEGVTPEQAFLLHDRGRRPFRT